MDSGWQDGQTVQHVVEVLVVLHLVVRVQGEEVLGVVENVQHVVEVQVAGGCDDNARMETNQLFYRRKELTACSFSLEPCMQEKMYMRCDCGRCTFGSPRHLRGKRYLAQAKSSNNVSQVKHAVNSRRVPTLSS